MISTKMHVQPQRVQKYRDLLKERRKKKKTLTISLICPRWPEKWRTIRFISMSKILIVKSSKATASIPLRKFAVNTRRKHVGDTERAAFRLLPRRSRAARSHLSLCKSVEAGAACRLCVLISSFDLNFHTFSRRSAPALTVSWFSASTETPRTGPECAADTSHKNTSWL